LAAVELEVLFPEGRFTAGHPQSAVRRGRGPEPHEGRIHPDKERRDVRATRELPFGFGKSYMNRNTALDAVLEGWRLAGTFIYPSGTPFTVLDNGVNDYSQAGNVFADPVSGVSPKPSNRSLAEWFNPAAFETPAQQGNGVFGTGGRNTLFGPKLSNVNLSLAKTWHYEERFRFELRGDFINAFNHPSFDLPNNDMSSSGVGTITSVANGPRTIQLGARLSF